MKCMHNIIVHTKTSTVQITLTDVLVSQHHVIKYISVKYFLLLYQAPDTGWGQHAYCHDVALKAQPYLRLA